jgi:hypothetical protein
MLGTIVKYSLAAAVGAIAFAIAMHHTDDCAYEDIKAKIAAHEALLRKTIGAEEDIKPLMADFIRANRVIWDNTYITKDTMVRVNELYAVWL